jgi:hypothetical protein
MKCPFGVRAHFAMHCPGHVTLILFALPSSLFVFYCFLHTVTHPLLPLQHVIGTKAEREVFARAVAALWTLGGCHDFLRPGAAVVTRRTASSGSHSSGGTSGADVARAALLHSMGAVDGWDRHVRATNWCLLSW